MEDFLKKKNNTNWKLSDYEEKIKSSCEDYQHLLTDLINNSLLSFIEFNQFKNIITPHHSINEIKYLISNYQFLDLNETRLFQKMFVSNEGQEEKKTINVLNIILTEIQRTSESVKQNKFLISTLGKDVKSSNRKIMQIINKYIESQIKLIETLLKCILNEPYLTILIKDKDEYIPDLLIYLVSGNVKISTIEHLQKIMKIPIDVLLPIYTNAENNNIETFKYGVNKILKIRKTLLKEINDNEKNRKSSSRRKSSKRRKSSQKSLKSNKDEKLSLVNFLIVPIVGASKTNLDNTDFFEYLLKYISKEDLKQFLKEYESDGFLITNCEKSIVYYSLSYDNIKLSTFLLKDLNLDISESLFNGTFIDLTTVDNPSCIKLILEYFKKHPHYTESTWQCIKELKKKLSKSQE